MKSNYQAVCVAYKIGAATRGEIGGLREKQGQGKHCLLVRYEEPHREILYIRCF